jgi:hypothetical protein
LHGLRQRLSAASQWKAGADGGRRERQNDMNGFVVAGLSGLGVFCAMALKSLLTSR